MHAVMEWCFLRCHWLIHNNTFQLFGFFFETKLRQTFRNVFNQSWVKSWNFFVMGFQWKILSPTVTFIAVYSFDVDIRRFLFHRYVKMGKKNVWNYFLSVITCEWDSMSALMFHQHHKQCKMHLLHELIKTNMEGFNWYDVEMKMKRIELKEL